MDYAIIVENLCDWTLCKTNYSYLFSTEIDVIMTTDKSSFIVGERRFVSTDKLKKISDKEAKSIISNKYYRFNKLSIDFDGTLATNPTYESWPKVGKQKLIHKLIASYVRYLKKKGWIIILNTVRESGKGLEEAKKFCEDKNIPIDLYNENLILDTDKFGYSRKIGCTRSIDDTQIGLIGLILRRFS